MSNSILLRDKGFTLVELAIALMVIGLLIGGVLKGQELIENAKVTATMRQIKAYDAATMIFRNTYNALPGDIKRPNRIPNCTAEICNIGGNGNGKINPESSLSPQDIELFNFFPHLTKAGMIQEPEGGTEDDMAEAKANPDISAELFFPIPSIDAPKIMVFSGGIAPTYATNTMWANTHLYEISHLLGKSAAALDQKMDDGIPVRGTVLVEDHNACTPYNVDTEMYDESSYIPEEICTLFIQAGF